MTDRELIRLIVQNCRKDGQLMLNLPENTIWSDHFGWGFEYGYLNVRIKTNGKITDHNEFYSVELGFFSGWYAWLCFHKLKKEIKQAKKNALEREINYDAKLNRGLLEESIKNLGSGE